MKESIIKKKSIFNLLKYIFSLLFTGIIIYFLFRNQDPVVLIEKISEVDMQWVFLSMIFGGWAIVNRGIRWIVLIDALGYKSSKLNSIAAVSVGYFTNLFFPRAGEISRCTALNKSDKIPVNKLFGTILIERVIDFVFLIVLFFLTLSIKFDLILDFFTKLNSQNSDLESNSFNLYYMILLGLFLCLSIVIDFLEGKILKNSLILRKKIKDFFKGLKEGFTSIKKLKKKSVFWYHTFSIWVMYFLMTYICFEAIPETSHLTISDGLFLLVLGGVGMVIPTPGGIGSYHAIVMIGLSVLGVGTIFLAEGGDSSNPALLFPTIMHAAQTLVAIIMGCLGLIVLLMSKRKKRL